MKKKAIIGLLFLTLCFVAGGLYITSSINQVINRLENVISLHEVRFLRENLLNRIKIAQTDLLLRDSPHATNTDAMVRHGEELEEAIGTCFRCHHHSKPIDQRLGKLRNDVGFYLERLSRVYTLRADPDRVKHEKNIAFSLGEQIRSQIGALVPPSAAKISQRIALARNKIFQTRQLVIALVTLGPLLILLITFLFVRRFTGSIEALIKATRKIKEGELTYKIPEEMHDEFEVLAAAFHDMGISLKGQRLKMESAQKHYRMLFESAGDAIFILEAEGEEAGRIISANQAAATMHGYTIEELQGMHIKELDTPKSAQKVETRIQRVLDGEWINIKVRHQRRDGSVFPVEASAGLFEVDGHKYILAFDRDISERVKTEKALRRSKQMAMVGQMAAGLAHEIKNPLAGIKVSMEVFAADLEIDQEDKEIFFRIIGEINRIEKLLKNLLNYARPPKPQMESLDVNKVLDSAIKNFELSLKSPAWVKKAKEISIDKRQDPSLPHTMADSAQLQQVFLNLLLNAAEAIPGSGTISIETGTTPSGDMRIAIADTGMGIDEQSLKEIFNPFFTTKSKGTGLGLAISKRLIEQLNGTITAENNTDSGATFTLILAMAPEGTQTS
jgi:two-component system sensor histidine kinase AtoS